MVKKLKRKSPLDAADCSEVRGMARIRRYYGVPAKRGMTVTYGMDGGLKCLIVGSKNDRLIIRPMMADGTWSRRKSYIHPTWRVSYPQNVKHIRDDG